MDQCTHEVRAEYWKKIIQACAASRRAVSQKLDGGERDLRTELLSLAAEIPAAGLWTDESIRPNEPVRGNRSGGNRNNRHFFCGAPRCPAAEKDAAWMPRQLSSVLPH